MMVTDPTEMERVIAYLEAINETSVTVTNTLHLLTFVVLITCGFLIGYKVANE